MQQRRCGIGQRDLRIVDLGALKGFQPDDLVLLQVGEETHEAADIGVFRVAPELPVFVRALAVRVEPDSAVGRLAHLAARSRRDQVSGQAEGLAAFHLVYEVDAADDIAPLVRAAELDAAAMALEQFEEVIGLHQQVVELEEGVGLLGGEAPGDRVLLDHRVDGEVDADLAQQLDVAELVQPVRVVDHDGV